MSFSSGSWSNVLNMFGSGTAASQYIAIQAGNKLYLDGAGGTTYLQESSDGHLEINVGTTLDLTAPTVDINSSTELNIDTAAYDLNASGAITLDGATVTIKGTGASKYGEQVPIDGSRDNLKESIEELLDLCVYLSAVALELHEKYEKIE